MTLSTMLHHLLALMFLMLAGSSGGGEPPHGHPHSFGAPYQTGGDPDDQATPPVRRKKSGRGIAKGARTLLRVAEQGRPVPLAWEDQNGTMKAVGENGASYYSSVGIQVRHYCDPCHTNWSSVPAEQRNAVLLHLQDLFEIDMNDPTISAVVNRDCRERYTDWKHKLHKHFKKNGGADDLVLARKTKPDSIRSDQLWNQCVDRFIDPAFQTRSQKSSQNRSKNTMRSLHGRLSYAGHMDRSVDPQTQQGVTPVENWIKFHVGPDGLPLDADSAAKIAELNDRSTQASASGTPVDDVAILEEVLGTTRGYRKGLGPSIPGSSPSVSSRSSFSGQSSAAALSQAEYDKRMADMLFWNEHMARMFPDMRPPSMSGAGGSTTPPGSPARDLTRDSP